MKCLKLKHNEELCMSVLMFYFQDYLAVVYANTGMGTISVRYTRYPYFTWSWNLLPFLCRTASRPKKNKILY